MTKSIKTTRKDISKLAEKLDKPNREYLNYKNALEKWHDKKNAIIGKNETPESIKWLENKLDEIKQIPSLLTSLRKQRKEISKKIYLEITKLTQSYKKLYKPVQNYVEYEKVSDNEYSVPLSFSVIIKEEGFAQTFLEKINRSTKGTFSGLEESDSHLRKLIQKTNFNDVDKVLDFIEEITESLHYDRRQNSTISAEIDVSVQLRKGETPSSIYDYIYSLSYLKPRYSLNYDGKEINQLSPGERGLLLLIFYLLIDKEDIPLIIDQPEENLDNETIYSVLVHCLKKAKIRRQVIIVTHNLNLAVVCDAEQVIHAKRDSKTNSIDYNSGAIENPDINKYILDVLEGTEPAFKKRDSRYLFRPSN